MRVYIFVDDERGRMFNNLAINATAAGIDCYWCKNYDSAIKRIKIHAELKDTIFLDLDHDLGEKKTGYDIAKYVVEHQIPLYGFSCHSLNPVGRKNIEDLLQHYGYKKGM